jgi:choline kinase
VLAVILAAGDGGRLHQHTSRLPKPLVPVSGRPLISYTLDALAQARVHDVLVVTGYLAEQLEAGIEDASAGLTVRFAANPRFRDGASYSLRAAREAAGDQPFLLLMADHLLSPAIIGALLAAARPGGPSLIATDASHWPVDYVDEATRVRLRPGTAEVARIGKQIEPFDALDTGAFLLSPDVWAVVDRSPEDCELSVIFTALAAEGAHRAVDVSGATWYDVDTVADLEAANRLVAAGGAR